MLPEPGRQSQSCSLFTLQTVSASYLPAILGSTQGQAQGSAEQEAWAACRTWPAAHTSGNPGEWGWRTKV